DLRTYRDRIECFDGADRVEIDRYIGTRCCGGENGYRPFGAKAVRTTLLCSRTAKDIIKRGDNSDQNDRDCERATFVPARLHQALLAELTVHRRIPGASAANRRRVPDKDSRLPVRERGVLGPANL